MSDCNYRGSWSYIKRVRIVLAYPFGLLSAKRYCCFVA